MGCKIEVHRTRSRRARIGTTDGILSSEEGETLVMDICTSSRSCTWVENYYFTSDVHTRRVPIKGALSGIIEIGNMQFGAMIACY